MRCFSLLFLLVGGCAGGVTPTVQIAPSDTVVELSLSEDCSARGDDWLDVDGAFLESGDSLLLRVQQCEGSRLVACGAMAPESIYPGWFRVTVAAGGEPECASPVERVLRIDLSSSPYTEDPGLDRVDQRGVRPSEEGRRGPRSVSIWVVGD